MFVSSAMETAGRGVTADPADPESVVGISDAARSAIVETADGVGTNAPARSGVATED